MQSRSVVSVVVGALATMTLAGSAFLANPQETEDYDPQTDAWLWRADAKALAHVPFGRAILDPQTTHAADGSVLVSSRNGGPTVRFDSSTQRFVPYPEAPTSVPKPPEAHRHAVPHPDLAAVGKTEPHASHGVGTVFAEVGRVIDQAALRIALQAHHLR